MAQLSAEILASKRDIELIKGALSRGDDDGNGSVFLGLSGRNDREPLLKLLQLSMQQLDRLREKEIELIKAAAASAASAGGTGQYVQPLSSSGDQTRPPCR